VGGSLLTNRNIPSLGATNLKKWHEFLLPSTYSKRKKPCELSLGWTSLTYPTSEICARATERYAAVLRFRGQSRGYRNVINDLTVDSRVDELTLEQQARCAKQIGQKLAMLLKTVIIRAE
jgi:hypothetical protein